jgi:phage-related protein
VAVSSSLKPVIWVGDTLKQVRQFPKAVQSQIGAALYDAQRGLMPPSAKPFKGVAGGVFEIVTRHDTNTYRTVYAVQVGKRLYVLHAFQKKSPRGIKTETLDIQMIQSRYRLAIDFERDEMKS